jgi:poly(hydroxyalkanoate) depolymerase family esterase
MPSLGETLAALRARRPVSSMPAGSGRLVAWQGFAPNPGQLSAHVHVPANLKRKAALVVVLHGCTQTANGYDHGSGWSQLADRQGFALLFPEQARSNNANLCFNWFEPGDTARGQGEAASIHAMIGAMIAEHGLDRERVFITGLSAGGAMTASLLASYPDVFAAGAVIAGVAHGVAQGVPQAFETMRAQKPVPVAKARAALLAASPGAGDWPRVAIWHGSADAVVAPANAATLVAQWRDVTGAAGEPETRRVDGAEHRLWRRADSQVALETWSVPGMGHGTPIAPGRDGLGRAMPYMLDHGISSTARIAMFFGLLDEAGLRRMANEAAARPANDQPPAAGHETSRPERQADMVADVLERALPGRDGVNGSIKEAIDAALRKAGLR